MLISFDDLSPSIRIKGIIRCCIFGVWNRAWHYSGCPIIAQQGKNQVDHNTPSLLPNYFSPSPQIFPLGGKLGYTPTPAPHPFLFCSPKTHAASPEEPPSALQLGEDVHNLAPVYGQETAVGGHVVLKGHGHGDGVWGRNRRE